MSPLLTEGVADTGGLDVNPEKRLDFKYIYLAF